MARNIFNPFVIRLLVSRLFDCLFFWRNLEITLARLRNQICPRDGRSLKPGSLRRDFALDIFTGRI